MIIRGAWGWSFALLLIALAVTLGTCVLDGADHDGHGAGLDLCLALLDVSLASALLAGLLPAGWMVARTTVPVRSASPRVLAPPPRSH